MTVDDLLAYRVMFGGVQLALGVYMIVSLFLLSERSSQLLLSAVIFTTVGVYRIAGFTFAKASKKQFWFGIAELGLGVVAAAIMF